MLRLDPCPPEKHRPRCARVTYGLLLFCVFCLQRLSCRRPCRESHRATVHGAPGRSLQNGSPLLFGGDVPPVGVKIGLHRFSLSAQRRGSGSASLRAVPWTLWFCHSHVPLCPIHQLQTTITIQPTSPALSWRPCAHAWNVWSSSLVLTCLRPEAMFTPQAAAVLPRFGWTCCPGGSVARSAGPIAPRWTARPPWRTGPDPGGALTLPTHLTAASLRSRLSSPCAADARPSSDPP